MNRSEHGRHFVERKIRFWLTLFVQSYTKQRTHNPLVACSEAITISSGCRTQLKVLPALFFRRLKNKQHINFENSF